MSLLNETLVTALRQMLSNNTNTEKSLVFKFSLLSLAGLIQNETNGQLIDIIEKGISYLEKDDYNAFEQTLHEALKIADDLTNYDEITYVYDLLANAALFMEKDHEKSKFLLIQVFNRLLNQGMDEDDYMILFITLKISKTHELVNDCTSEIGYKFCVHHLNKKLKSDPHNKVALGLYVITFETYANYLANIWEFDAAIKCFKKAYKTSVKLNGEVFEANINLLNAIGNLYYIQKKLNISLKHFKDAEKIGKQLPGLKNFSKVHINLSYVYLEQGMLKEAERYCKRGIKNAIKHCYDEGKKEGNICLVKVQNAMKRKN